MTGAWRYHWDWTTCRKIWHWYPVVSKAERAFKLTAPMCVRGAALAIPLLLPGAAFLPPVPQGGVVLGGPVLSGPAYEIGTVFAPGFYETPLGWFQTPPAVLASSGLLTEIGGAAVPLVAVDKSPTLTPMLSGDVPHWLPDREVPQTDVPEPSTWMVMVGALVGCLGLRRWMR